jgi:hypothetical protein
MGLLNGCERDTLWADRNFKPKGYLFWTLNSDRHISPSPLTGEGEGEQNLILPAPLHSFPPGEGI